MAAVSKGKQAVKQINKVYSHDFLTESKGLRFPGCLSFFNAQTVNGNSRLLNAILRSLIVNNTNMKIIDYKLKVILSFDVVLFLLDLFSLFFC